MNKTTQQLLANAENGDKSAINDLMDRHRNDLRKLVRMRLDKRTQQRVDVSDVVQEILVDAYKRLPKYLADPTIPFHVWLRLIARDRIIDTYRRHRLAATRSLDREQSGSASLSRGDSNHTNLADMKAGSLTPAAMAMQKEIASQVDAAISSLRDSDSEILLLRHYEMLSNQQVSEVLNLSIAAASMRYARALGRLKIVLHEKFKPK